MTSLFPGIFKKLTAVLCVLVLITTQQAAAFTQDDFRCANQGDNGGSCFYDPNACSNSSPSDSTPTGANINNDAAQQAAKKASTGSTKVGYALYDSTGKLVANYNDSFENYGASITKSMLLVAYLKQVGSGSLDASAKSELTNMIENSDNDSANWVYDHINNSAASVNSVASAAGMSGFKLDDSSDPVYHLGQSKITANDFAKFFSKIDTMFPASQKDFGLNLLSHLSSVDQNGLLQSGLPGTVYSKEGWKPESSGYQGAPYIVNQAAQFTSGGTTYGVAVTVGGTSDQASGETIVKDVVSALTGGGGPPSAGAVSSCCNNAGGAGGDSGNNDGADSGTWDSGLRPPYILEQWAIEVLKDLAKKKGVSETDAVTQAHVIALVAFAIGEGGDIENSDLFNPLNTGIDAPDLVNGSHDVSGVQSFKSFDAGVEAAARTLAESGYSRLAAPLLDPNGTAQQFMYALSYNWKYGHEWAGASNPADPSYDPNYYQGRLALVQQVRSDYKGTAGLVIGTSALEQADNITKPALLQFDGKGGAADATTSGTDCSSVGGQGAQSILEEALKLAWPSPNDSSGNPHGNTPKPEYAAALRQFNAGNYTGDVGNDCGVFVSTVVRAAGVDKNYPQSGTGAQWAYVVSHSDLYDIQYNVTSMGDLQPGDILIVGGPGGAGAAGHTWIYVGKQPGGYTSASASLGSRTGNLTNDTLTDSAAAGGYMRVRVK